MKVNAEKTRERRGRKEGGIGRGLNNRRVKVTGLFIKIHGYTKILGWGGNQRGEKMVDMLNAGGPRRHAVDQGERRKVGESETGRKNQAAKNI